MAGTTQRVNLSSRGTGWADSVSLDQIDPAVGIQFMSLSLDATLASQVSVESLEAAASRFVSTDTAVVSLSRPDGSLLLDARARTMATLDLAAADGTTDYAGAAGTQSSASATGSGSITFIPSPASSADAGLLIGTGTLQLPVSASARIAATGPGNMVALFHSSVAAAVSTAYVAGGAGFSSFYGVSGIDLGIPPRPPVIPPIGVAQGAGQTQVIADQTTGWTAQRAFDGFDPAVGTLVGVRVQIKVDAASTVAAENLDPEASSVSVDQAATVSLAGSNGAALAGATLAMHTGEALGAFDGTVDYAGVSGASATQQASAGDLGFSDTVLTDAATLAAFTAAGLVSVGFSGTGTTAVDGPGNLAISTALLAGATVTLSYQYTPANDVLFDRGYYLAQNPDVAAAGVDPYQHYLRFGWHEGRNPSAWFDTNYYLTQNPDVRAAGVDPLLHFEAFGWKEGRAPSLLFDDAKYLAANPDVAAAGIDPLAHYLGNGQSEGRATFLTGGSAAADPLVDAAYYDRQLGATLVPEGVAGARQAAYSYDSTGWQKGLNPDALFDTAFYLSHNPDVAAAHVDPLLHYETYGWHEGRDPSAAFSTNKYLAAYADVKAAGIDPLLHYVVSGQYEGRSVFGV